MQRRHRRGLSKRAPHRRSKVGASLRHFIPPPTAKSATQLQFYLSIPPSQYPLPFSPIMSLIFRRGVASMASLKKASKVVCIGRNYAFVLLTLSNNVCVTDSSTATTSQSSTARSPNNLSSSSSLRRRSCHPALDRSCVRAAWICISRLSWR